MKKFLVLMVFITTISCCAAQDVVWMKTEAFSCKVTGSQYWEPWQPLKVSVKYYISDTKITLTLFTAEVQYYTFKEVLNDNTVKGISITKYYCIDKDGRNCNIYVKSSKTLYYIYIEYSDLQLAYKLTH